jgi:hypothetical protein
MTMTVLLLLSAFTRIIPAPAAAPAASFGWATDSRGKSIIPALAKVTTSALSKMVLANAQWQQKTPMSTARGQTGVVAHPYGKIYVFGGYAGGNAISTMEVYDIVTNTWSSASPLPVNDRGMASAIDDSGFIYSFGGIQNNSYRYNPTTNTWAPIPAPPSLLIWEAAAVTGADGRIYVFGGQQTSGYPYPNVQIYDPATSTWTQGSAMPTARYQLGAVLGKNGLIYTIGGRDSTTGNPVGVVDIYNPSTDTWSTGAPMPTPRNQFGIALAPDGTIYTIGGKINYLNNTTPFFNTVEVYNPATDSWRPDTSLPTALGELSAVTSANTLYAIGGTNGAFVALNQALLVKLIDTVNVPHITVSPRNFMIGPTDTTVTTMALCNTGIRDTLQYTLESVPGGQVAADSAAGRLAAGACRNVTLTFSRSGLLPGNNIVRLSVHHNALLDTNPLSVLCTLVVDSASVPRIALTPASFRIRPTDTNVQTIQICNTSTRDTLQYSIDTVAGRRVVADTVSGRLAPGACRNVQLTFNRFGLPLGNTIVQMLVRHNSPLSPNPLSVPCTLVVDSASVPHIAMTPASFRIRPTDTNVQTLKICNTGIRDTLQYTIRAGGSNPNILAWIYGADSIQEYTYTAAAIRTLIPSATITTTRTTDPATLSSLLVGRSVFLIPEQEVTSPSAAIGTAFAPVLDAFVRNGGTVIVMLPYSVPTFLSYAGLDTLSYYSTTSSGTVTVLNPTHHVFDSVPIASLQMNNATTYWTGSSTATRLATYNGYAVCTERLKGSGAIYLLGPDFYTPNTTTWGRMLANCVSRGSSHYVTADTASGRLAAGECRNVQLTFDRNGLLPGQTVFQLIIDHNSPLSPDPLSVQCTLVVDSASVPHIALTPGSFRVGPTDPKVDTLAICNSSTHDSLQFTIDSVAGRRAVVDTAAGRIAAGGCRNVFLTFDLAGLPLGNTIVQLVVRHNSPLGPNPLSVPCTLYVDSASVPHIALTPGSFMIGPAYPALDTLTICNTSSLGTLRYTVAKNGSTPNILAWTYGAEMTSRYPNTVAAIRQRIPSANITTTTTTAAATLSALLQTADVFLIPAQYTNTPSSTIGTAFRPVLDTFIRRGGIVIALLPYWESAFLTASGLDSIAYSSYTYSYTATVNAPADPVFDSISAATFTMPYYTGYWTGSTAAVRLASYSSYAVCTKQTRGSGVIYLLGADFYNTDAVWTRMIDNCILQNFSTASITVDSSSGSVAAGGCRNVQLTFNRTGLLPGTNVFKLRVRHDSPLSPDPLSVLCTLVVDSASVPHIALTPGSFRIGPTDTNVQTLQICNTGTLDTLEYTIHAGGGVSNLNILAWIYGADSAQEYVNTAAAIRTFIPSATITTTRTTDPATLSSFLVGRSVFLIPEQEVTAPSSAIGTAFAPILDTFVRNGGTVIVLAPTYPSGVASFLSAAGLETLSSSYSTSSGTVTVNIPAHPVFDSVAIASILMTSLTGYWTGTSGATVLASYSGYAVCTERLKGSGAIYLLGPDFYTSITPTWGRMLANCVTRNFSSSLYVTADTASGRLMAGECRNVQLTFDRSGFLPGQTVFQLIIDHNSPLSPDPLSVQCTITVLSNIPVLIPYTPDPTVNRLPELRWHPVVSASLYTLEASLSPTFSTLEITLQTADTTFKPAAALPLGMLYWRVRCDLTPRYSLPDNFYIQNDSIPLLIPIVPDTLGTQTSTLFSWHPTTGATSYKIMIYSIDSTVPSPILLTYLTDTSYLYRLTLPSARYMWTVSANFDYTRTAYPDTFWVQSTPVIPQWEQRNLPTAYGLKVTAASGQMRISCAIPRLADAGVSRGGNVAIEMFDIRGKLVRVVFNGMLTAGYHNLTVCVENVAAGIYYCRMRAGNQQKIAAVHFVR